uniref:TNFR-Cys domain-containing protein n=1 Tax=Hucho hucho TaxID=62062 RepID=A0A4W5K651_9TELE
LQDICRTLPFPLTRSSSDSVQQVTIMLLLLVMVYVVRLSEACGTANDCCMCPPGTRLGEGGTCDDPQCTPCQSDEYMTSYNREKICHLQPYCDPNLNFETRGYCDGTKRHTCRCKDGFHCSNSDFCILCIPHSTCQERFVPIVPGNHTHDVVCGPTPDQPTLVNPVNSLLLFCLIPVSAVVVGIIG